VGPSAPRAVEVYKTIVACYAFQEQQVSDNSDKGRRVATTLKVAPEPVLDYAILAQSASPDVIRL
jgi:hypothetical protein